MMLKLFGKAIKTYREQGLGTVWAKVKKIGPVRFFWIRAEILGKLHRDHLPDAAEDMLQQWWVYSYFKRKYAKILRESNYSYDVEKAETPKIIWWCWFQGEENAPDLCKACLASLRLNYPDYDIRVVTQENLHQYVHMPDYIEEKFRKGQIGAAHYSDILRTLLLIEHGGAWIDSTVFSTKRAEDLLRQPFFVYQNFMKENKACVLSNWMIVSSRGGNPILLLTRDLLFQYWKDYSYTAHYFIFHLFFTMAAERYREFWRQVPVYSNVPVHVLQFELFAPYRKERFEQIKHMADFHKLTHHRDAETEGDVSGTNYAYILQAMQERMKPGELASRQSVE